MTLVRNLRSVVVLWVRSRAESWATPDIEDYIDPAWQRHEGLLRATHPKPQPQEDA